MTPELQAVIESARAATERLSLELERGDAHELRTRRAELLEASGLDVTDEDLEQLVHDRLEPMLALLLAQSWFADLRSPRPAANAIPPARMLVLLGGVGVGKTVAAGWVLARERGLFRTADAMRRLYESKSPRARDEFERLLRAPLLVVDNVGAERELESAQASLHALVDGRQKGVRTIITANLTRAALEARYDARTWSRLVHVARIEVVPGEDLRGRR